MSKTIEIWHHGHSNFEIVSPDRDEIVYANGYTIEVDGRGALMENGVQTVDIQSDEYFHIEKEGNHATITIEDEPPGPEIITKKYENTDGRAPPIIAKIALVEDDFVYDSIRVGSKEYDLVEK